MNRVRLLIADDHKLVRAGIKVLLEEFADFEVVGEAGDGEEALRLCLELQPQVVILDIAMPVLSGFQALECIHQQCPEVRVVMLSMDASEEHIIRCLHLGACGYVLKNAVPEELEQAVRAAVAGEIWWSSLMSRQAITDYLIRVRPTDFNDTLSFRQHQVLKLIAESLSTKEIAFALNLSSKTVETHRAHIMRKLQIQDVAGLVRYAIRNGIAQA